MYEYEEYVEECFTCSSIVSLLSEKSYLIFRVKNEFEDSFVRGLTLDGVFSSRKIGIDLIDG